MSSLLSAELSATCNALGTFDKITNKYLIDEFTLNTVKDLIRYLRRDGEEHEIRRHFGRTKVLQADLLPMLVHHSDNAELFDVTLRLLVNLTNPALLLYREEVPTERTAHHNYMEILSHLQAYKEEAFTKVEHWTVFANKLTKILEIDVSERDEDTGLVIERILILLRNALHVPADLDRERRPENDANVHDQVLWALNQSGMLDILLYMVSSSNEQQYFMHILEILSHLLREQCPGKLAEAALQRSGEEKLRDEEELLAIRGLENRQRLSKIKQYSGSRHSRFGGTYVIQNMKSISEHELITLKPLNSISALDFGGKKARLPRPKNRRPQESGLLERRSAFAIRLFLKEFCVELLAGCYNRLAAFAKDALQRAKAQANDESYLLWAVRFFMEFNRHHRCDVGLVSETMSVSMFHFVQQQMEKYLDMIRVEKKRSGGWARRLSIALRAYKELLLTLRAMAISGDSRVREAANVLQANVFYVLEYREFVLATFLAYDETKMPRSYLMELVETVHLFLKMLQHFCKKTGLVVQKKLKRKTKTKKKPPPRGKPPPPEKPSPPPWAELQPQLAVALAHGADADDADASGRNYPPPFDAASDVPIDQQRESCMRRVQRCLRDHRLEDAVGLFRAAREVWPSGEFGQDGVLPEEELSMLEAVYAADLGEEPEVQEPLEESNEMQENSEYEDEEDEQEARAHAPAVVESDFDFADFARRFCHPRILQAVSSLLTSFDRNSATTNHSCAKLLHRCAVDAGLTPMLFSASLFRTFQRLLANPHPRFQELQKLATFVFRQFTARAATEPKLFIELLFWKTAKEAVEIQHGYDKYDHRDKAHKGAWSEEQEDELRRLYMENQTNPEGDQDVIDWILDNLVDGRHRTRRGVIAKLKELGLIFRAPTKKSNRQKAEGGRNKPFSEEEDALLQQLWPQIKDDEDPMSILALRMPNPRSRKSLVQRLTQLGLAEPKDCRKKRRKGVKSGKSDRGDDSGDSLDDSSSRSPSPSPPPPAPRRAPAPAVSAAQTARLLVKAVDEGFAEALSWLAESLEEVALDQEAEGFSPSAEGVPLVPLVQSALDAMDSGLFQQLLTAIGVQPPSDEQESYWRIPSSLHFETIRKRREVIMKAINRELIVDMSEPIESIDVNKPSTDVSNKSTAVGKKSTNRSSDESSDDDLFDNLRRMRDIGPPPVISPIKIVPSSRVNKSQTSRKRSRSNDAMEESGRGKMQKIDEDEGEAGEGEGEEDILSFARRTLRRDDDSGDEHDSDTREQVDADSSDDQLNDRSNTRKRVDSDSSDDQNDGSNTRKLDNDSSDDQKDNDRSNKLGGEHSDEPVSPAAATVLASDEDEPPVQPAKNKKRRAVIDDDSD